MADTLQTDKDKGRQMLQKVGAEAIGTFALVFAGCGAIMVDQISGGTIGHVGVSLGIIGKRLEVGNPPAGGGQVSQQGAHQARFSGAGTVTNHV